MERWYVLYTKPNAEYAASRFLTQKGYQTYLPEVKTSHPRRGYDTVPLFPSYLFARFDWTRLVVQDIYQTPGVRTIVTFNHRPAVVPDEVIVYIQQRVEAINAVGGLPNHNFQPGDVVYIRSGPLAGLEAIFEGPMGPRERVWVLVHILGALNRAEVPVEVLEPAQGAAIAVGKGKRKLPRRTRGRGRRIRNAPPLHPPEP